ncbi:MAG TPA: hypothetical protein VHC46_04360, partial [Thermodesulfobacteriota bacterium]|nr:hypothetical protein [Thermodesulfobacteriota bacterium]
MNIKKALLEFPARYKIVPPLLGLTAGIMLNEYMGNPWLLIAISAPLFGLFSLLRPELRFLLFIPIGILFAAGPFSSTGMSVSSYEGIKTDLEGIVYRPPEKRESGSRIFLDAEYAVSGGKF